MSIKTFQNVVWDFYKKNGRDLPWRKTTDPYKILVSEIMLQQTQVSRVIEKYKEFVLIFPSFLELSKAPQSDVLRVWQGLGYNRRAIYLKRIAERMVKDFNGVVPSNPKLLKEFPGIGGATAASIVVFSYNIPLVFIETNIRRVFIYHKQMLNQVQHDTEYTQHNIKIHDNELYPLIKKTLDKNNPREWYFALMDYGSYLAKNPSAGGDNPNRKSKHYVKQSKFKGSLRQMRGEILRRILHEKEITNNKLRTGLNEQFFQKAFEQLEKEGFLLKKDKKVLIKP